MFKKLSDKSTQFFARRHKVNFTIGGANAGMAAFTVADFMLTGGTISVGSLAASTFFGGYLLHNSTSNKYQDAVYNGKTYRLDEIHYKTFRRLADKIEDKKERLESGSTRNPQKLAGHINKLEKKMAVILEGRLKEDLRQKGQNALNPKKPPRGN